MLLHSHSILHDARPKNGDAPLTFIVEHICNVAITMCKLNGSWQFDYRLKSLHSPLDFPWYNAKIVDALLTFHWGIIVGYAMSMLFAFFDIMPTSTFTEEGCKGTYACVRPRRYTYCIYWNTVANVDASDSRCRCIGKIIARDVRLVASRPYRLAITRPGSCAAVTLSPR